jgi:hypothetical protein
LPSCGIRERRYNWLRVLHRCAGTSTVLCRCPARTLILNDRRRPPFGDIDDRIRTIAQALNLTSILWQSDSDDWRINTGTPPVTSAQIDANYQNVINGVNNGTYNERGTIMLTHELNNFTMSEAIKWYPMLKAAFSKLVPIASAYNLTHPYAEGNISCVFACLCSPPGNQLTQKRLP